MKTQLKTSKKLVKHLGANAVEYGLVMALVTALVLGASNSMEDGLTGFFEKASTQIQEILD